jgi:hypothetical protein
MDYNATRPRTFVQSFIAIRYIKYHIPHYMHLCYWCFLDPGLPLGAPTRSTSGGFKISKTLRAFVASTWYPSPSRFPGSSRWASAQSLSTPHPSRGCLLVSAFLPPRGPVFPHPLQNLRNRTHSSAGRPGVSEFGPSLPQVVRESPNWAGAAPILAVVFAGTPRMPAQKLPHSCACVATNRSLQRPQPSCFPPDDPGARGCGAPGLCPDVVGHPWG